MHDIETQAVVDINQTANKFQSSIVLRIANKFIDVKSILGLRLSLVSSESYKLEIHGPDDEEAKAAMIEVFGKHGLKVEMVENV